MLVFTLFLASKETRGLRRKQPGCVGSLWLQHRKLSAASSSGVQQQPELQGCPGSALPRVRCLRPFFFRVWVCWQQSPILCKLLKQLFFIFQMHRLPFAAPVGHPCSPSMWGLWGGPELESRAPGQCCLPLPTPGSALQLPKDFSVSRCCSHPADLQARRTRRSRGTRLAFHCPPRK